jgi:hypothetical protein
MRPLANFQRMKMHFPSCKFCLKKCQGEPAQFETTLQFGRAQQPVRTNPWLSFNIRNLGAMESLLGLQQVSSRPDLAMFGQKGAMGPI